MSTTCFLGFGKLDMVICPRIHGANTVSSSAFLKVISKVSFGVPSVFISLTSISTRKGKTTFSEMVA